MHRTDVSVVVVRRSVQTEVSGPRKDTWRNFRVPVACVSVQGPTTVIPSLVFLGVGTGDEEDVSDFKVVIINERTLLFI